MPLSDKNISNTVQYTAPAATKDKEVKIYKNTYNHDDHHHNSTQPGFK